MAMHHAEPLDIIDIRPFGDGLMEAFSTSLLKTPSIQLMRLVLTAGARMPDHRVPGAVTIQCLEGEALVSTPSRSGKLSAQQLMVLQGDEVHSVEAVTDTSLLVTIVMQS